MKKNDTLEAMFSEWRKDPAYIAAFEEAAPEFALYAAMLEAMQRSEMTQKQLAVRMKTSESAISRLFSSSHAPSWKTITRFAQALGKRPVIQFVDA